MTGLHEFILEITKPLNETFKTESGLELYGHKDFTVDRLANRVATVVNAPLLHDTPIKPGYEVMIEPSIFHKQIYRETVQDYTALVDRERMWFRVSPNMIILYRKGPDDTWKGYQKNTLTEPIMTEHDRLTSSFLIMPEGAKEFKKDRVKLVYGNDDLKEMGAVEGDELVINPIGGVKFWIDGKEYWWIRNTDIYAVAG